MSLPGSISPVRTSIETAEMVGYYTGAGAADLVKVVGSGIASVAYTATGKYTITFASGQLGALLVDVDVKVHTAANAAPLIGKFVPASVNMTAGTVDIELWALAGAGTATLANLAVTGTVTSGAGTVTSGAGTLTNGTVTGGVVANLATTLTSTATTLTSTAVTGTVTSGTVTIAAATAALTNAPSGSKIRVLCTFAKNST